MPIITTLILNLIVAVSAYMVTYRLIGVKNFSDSIITGFLVYFSQIVLTELLLGIAGILSLLNILLINILLLAIISFWSRKNTSSINTGYIKEPLLNLLSNKVLLFTLCVICSYGGVKILVNLVNPPFGWDSLNYHFTFAAEWLKHGNLNTPITIFDDPSPSYYPINGSLYYLWLMLPLKNVYLADLGQIPFFILAALCVYSISRKTGLTREYSCFAAFLFLLIPNFFKHMQFAYVDAMVAALFLCAVNALFLLSKDFSWQNALIFSVSFGLFIGTKTVALPYSILLFIPFAYLAIKGKRNWRYPAISMLVIIALGGFSYIRNLIETGNPLYPLDFGIFGINIFKGVMTKTIYSAHFKLKDYAFYKLFFSEGLGIQTLIFTLPAVILSLPVALAKDKKRMNFYFVYFLCLPLLIYLIYRFIIPLANTRYLYPALALGIIAGFYTFEKLNLPKVLMNALVIICVLGSMTELAKRKEQIVSLVITLLLFAFSPFILRYIKKRKEELNKKKVLAAITLAILLLSFTELYYVKNEFPGYEKMIKYSGFWPEAANAWDWLNRNTKADNIAYAGRPVPFPLYGTNLKNNVYYVSVNGTEPAKLHYFHDSRYQWDDDFLTMHKNFEAPGNYRAFADRDVWLFNILEKKTNYLFIYSLHQTKEIAFPIEDAWAKEKPEIFNLVFSNETIHIYKILK